MLLKNRKSISWGQYKREKRIKLYFALLLIGITVLLLSANDNSLLWALGVLVLINSALGLIRGYVLVGERMNRFFRFLDQPLGAFLFFITIFAILFIFASAFF